jgi:hypothetical protein
MCGQNYMRIRYNFSAESFIGPRRSLKHVLMVAFHYPPFSGSSGLLRTLKFSQYLPAHGWHPLVLTANPRAYPQVRNDQLNEIPSVKHLSVGRYYLRLTALPDRWASWWLGAVPAGMRLIKRYRPAVIWSTYPIATAHLIALTLHRLTGLPWVADFRDSMTEDCYPADISMRRCYRWIERQTVRHASFCVFTARATREMYLKRYPDLNPARCLLIPNGYDEKDFQGLTESFGIQTKSNRPTRLIHSGLLYPDDRDPRPFFRVVARLKNEGQENSKSLQIQLRAPGSEDYYSAILQDLKVEDMVSLLPSLPYKQSLQECLEADGLLLFQAASCNHQIPAKAYEYLRLRRPVFALTAEMGDTAALLTETGGATIVDLSDEQAIHSAFSRFLCAVRDRQHPLPSTGKVQQYDRQQQAAEMVGYLERLVGQSPLGSA